MATELYAGETVRIIAQDLADADGLPITAGATVTVALYDSSDTLIDSETAGNDGDDWYYDLTAPATAGIYMVKVTVEAGESIAKAKEQLTVIPF